LQKKGKVGNLEKRKGSSGLRAEDRGVGRE